MKLNWINYCRCFDKIKIFCFHQAKKKITKKKCKVQMTTNSPEFSSFHFYFYLVMHIILIWNDSKLFSIPSVYIEYLKVLFQFQDALTSLHVHQEPLSVFTRCLHGHSEQTQSRHRNKPKFKFGSSCYPIWLYLIGSTFLYHYQIILKCNMIELIKGWPKVSVSLTLIYS